MIIQYNWRPYIKPTQKKHDSGWHCFEVGYLDFSKNKKCVTSTGTDSLVLFGLNSLYKGMEKADLQQFQLMSDTKWGYIQFWNRNEAITNQKLHWKANWQTSDEELAIRELPAFMIEVKEENLDLIVPWEKHQKNYRK